MTEFAEHIDDELIVILEGLIALIGWRTIAYRKDGTRRKVMSYFRKEKDVDNLSFTKDVYGKEQLNRGAYLYPKYEWYAGMERLSCSMFGSNLYNFSKKSERYGNNFELASLDIISVGTIPIFHKHWGDNYYHSQTGEAFSQNKNMIWLDSNNFTEIRNQLIELKNNPSKRNDMREYNFEYVKSHTNMKSNATNLLK